MTSKAREKDRKNPFSNFFLKKLIDAISIEKRGTRSIRKIRELTSKAKHQQRETKEIGERADINPLALIHVSINYPSVTGGWAREIERASPN